MDDAFAAAHASAEDWAPAARRCAADLARGVDGANLGFVYVTDGIAERLPAIVEILREGTAIEQWVGTVGLGVCASGREYFDTPAISALAGRLPDDAFRVFEPVVAGFAEFEARHDEWCRRSRPYFGVVHGDPRDGSVADVVPRLSERMGSGFLVGGLSCSRGEYGQVAGRIVRGGVSGVLFSTDVPVTTRLTQGCSPIGPRRRITGARGSVVTAIDGRPALDVFQEDAGELIARDPGRAAGYIFAGLPVAGSDTGDYLVRNLVGIDPQGGAVAIAERVVEGDAIVFCRRDAKSAREDLQRMLDEIVRSIDRAPRAALYYTCVARGPNLFGPGSEELKLIEEALGAIPLTGFFGNGEISHNRLYGYTGVLTLFA